MAMTISNCTRCPLHSNSVCVGLGGRGSTKQNQILLVVGNPTTTDDLASETCSGRAGVLLDGLMHDAGFAEDTWRVTNAVRCVGKPGTDEIDSCRNYLKAEIAEYRPAVIVAFGDVAFRSLCKRAGLGNARGKSLPLHAYFEYEADVYPTYGPTHILAVPNYRDTVVADLRRVCDRLKEDEDVSYETMQVDRWAVPVPCAVDIETDYFVTGGEKVVQVGFYAPTLSPRPTISRTCPVDVSANPLITHNGWGFDVPVLRRNGAVVGSTGDDTMVLAYLDDETQPRGLEALSVKYLGVKGWKEGLHAEIGSEAFALYNARDVVHTYRLWEVLCERLGPRKRVHDHVMRPAHAAFTACSERGLYINVRAAAEFEAKYNAEAEGLLDRARSFGIDNPNSNRQVAQHFFGDKTKSVNKTALLEIGDEAAHTVLEYRHARKMLSTFIRPYIKLGRIHFPYNLLGTASGRVSARHHNMPRELKAMFGAPGGSCLVSVDYAAIEYRFAVWLAGVTDVLERYRLDPHFDPHRWFAGRFYDVRDSDVSKDQRQIAKSGNFGLLYKSSAEGLAEYAFNTSGVHMSLGTASLVRYAWLLAHPEIPRWWDQTEAFLKEHGYVETVTGRRRHFGDSRLLPKGGGLWNAMVREAVNDLIQSPCTDIAQTGLILCHRAGYPINGFFHDSVTFEFESYEAAKAEEESIRDLMTTQTVARLREVFDVDITVPLEVEFTYTQGE